MATVHGALNLLLLRRPEMNAGKFPLPPCPPPPSQFFFDEGTTKRHMEPSRGCRGDGPEPGHLAPLERSPVTWTLWALLNHTAEEVNIILFVGKRVRF